MNNKQKVIFGTLIFIILSALFVGYLFYIDQSETYSFGNFSIEAPKGYEFKDISDEYENNSFMKVYRCVNEDLTVSSIDKNYIESTYYNNTGVVIDFNKLCNDNIKRSAKVVNETNNLTTYVQTGYGHFDRDVAVVYRDDSHFIIIEGGDMEFISKIGNSIKILN